MSNGPHLPIRLRIETIEDRRIWQYYLIIPDLMVERLSELLEVVPDERFYKVLNEHVHAYIREGVMPPEQIMSTVMNVADDVMAGRDPVLRAGDYIAMQNYARG